ncbi:MAG: RluA family pseudouridine synthase [Christensenellales bacterium]|jgi:23S rRNA pseudouridine1911/1915/1917 synthase
MAAVNLSILYEDNHILVAVKPPGLLSQADRTGDSDMLTLLKEYIREKYHKPGAVYLGLVHRLDRPVGGVMVFARTSKAASRLSAQVREGLLEKGYRAVVCGRPPDGRITHDLIKDARTNTTRAVPPGTPGARSASLVCRALKERGGMTLCDIRLITGRSHQIRVQMAAVGCPLWGDQRYNPQARPGQWVALWAHELSFFHPVLRERMRFEAPLPAAEPWDLFA